MIGKTKKNKTRYSNNIVSIYYNRTTESLLQLISQFIRIIKYRSILWQVKNYSNGSVGINPKLVAVNAVHIPYVYGRCTIC